MANLRGLLNISDSAAYDRDTTLSHSHFHLKARLQSSDTEMIVNTEFIPTKYFDLIRKNAETVTLSDTDYIEYKFQPKKYCYAKLGSIELWPILLRLNNMTSASEFVNKTFKVPGNNIMEILNEILILESETIEKNNESIE